MSQLTHYILLTIRGKKEDWSSSKPATVD